MKKLIALFSTLVLLGAATFAKPTKSNGIKADKTSENSNVPVDDKKGGTAQAGKGKVSIAVPAPKGVNLGDGADWIPLFVQGVITANFQQYSGLTVIDRQNADMVKAEQRLSESAEFDEKNTLELGKMTSARFIITGSIMAKSNAYALTFNITDAQTGESKATASVPDCPRSALEDGTAANQISYDLMAGYGIALGDDAKKNLTQKATVMAAETNAQASVAKGIVAEKSGSNIEALTYYIQAKKSDRNLAEATSRMAGMTTVVTSGNFGANAKNMMQLRNDWDKLLLEAAGLIAANPPQFEVRYFTDIEPLELTTADYENGTMSFRMGAPYLKQVSGAENFKIVAELMCALWSIEQSENWGAKINGFPWTYADDIPGDHWLKWANSGKRESFPLTVALLDADKRPIARTPYTLFVDYDKQYTGFAISSSNQGNQTATFHKIVYDTSLKYSLDMKVRKSEDKDPTIKSYANFAIAESMRQGYRTTPSLSALKIPDVPIGNADTDKLYVAIESNGGRSVSVLPSDAIPMYRVLESEERLGKSIKIGGFFYNGGRIPGVRSDDWDTNYSRDHIWAPIGKRYKNCAIDISEVLEIDTVWLGYAASIFLGRCSSLSLPDNVSIIYGTIMSDTASEYNLRSLVLPVNFSLRTTSYGTTSLRVSYYDKFSIYNGSETELQYLFKMGAATDYNKWSVQCTGAK